MYIYGHFLLNQLQTTSHEASPCCSAYFVPLLFGGWSLVYIEESDGVYKITDGFQYDSWQCLGSRDTILHHKPGFKKKCLEH